MKNLNRWVYAIAGVIVLLMAGLIYAWSVMSQPIASARPDWTAAQLSLTFTLVMALDDEHGNLLTIEMLAATEQQCDRLSEQFKAHPEQIYNGVLDVLLTDFDGKEQS